MTKQYRITILDPFKGAERQRLEDKLRKEYKGTQVAPNLWECQLNPTQLEWMRIRLARPGHEVVKIELYE